MYYQFFYLQKLSLSLSFSLPSLPSPPLPTPTVPISSNPFLIRDRGLHLFLLLSRLIPILRNQRLSFRILVAEQIGGREQIRAEQISNFDSNYKSNLVVALAATHVRYTKAMIPKRNDAGMRNVPVTPLRR